MVKIPLPTKYPEIPDTGDIPLVADMSSCIISEPIVPEARTPSVEQTGAAHPRRIRQPPARPGSPNLETKWGR